MITTIFKRKRTGNKLYVDRMLIVRKRDDGDVEIRIRVAPRNEDPIDTTYDIDKKDVALLGKAMLQS